MSFSHQDHGSRSEVGQVFEQFKSYIDTRLDSLVGSLQSSSTQQVEDKEGIRASNNKLQREADASKFKYKANAKQFLHNAEVADLVGQVIKQLQKENPNHVQALEFASRALASIQKRQKLIKLADKSEAGWLAVDEYESDELADDSEDDKKIQRAQDKAVRKKKQLLLSRSKRQRTSSQNTGRPEDRQLFRGNASIACCLCVVQGLFANTSLAYI